MNDQINPCNCPGTAHADDRELPEASVRGSTAYAALSRRDQIFWSAALAALYCHPHLAGKATLDIATTPVPNLKALRLRLTLGRGSRALIGTTTVSLEEFERAWLPESMMFVIFARLFSGVEA